MFNNQTQSPSIRDHPCLTNRDTLHGHPFCFASGQAQRDGPKVERWFIETFDESPRGALIKESVKLIPLTFCPFCGAFLLVGQPADLVNSPLPISDFRPGDGVGPSAATSDTDEGEDE